MPPSRPKSPAVQSLEIAPLGELQGALLCLALLLQGLQIIIETEQITQ